MSRRHPNLTIILTLALLLVAPSPILATASTDERYFPATGHSVVGKFLAYWDAHGGLAQFGYPISDQLRETSPLNDKSYTVQYFERAAFEYHPENVGTPYEVMPTQLGTFVYNSIYPKPLDTASTDNPLYFPETDKTIGGKFRAYWESHGGLEQQGYPITNKFSEVSSLDGKTYTVQYFQRAEFELHPENAGTPYEVLLSQLGTARYHALYPTPSPRASTNDLYSLAMVSKDEGWAVGGDGVIQHYRAGRWVSVPSPLRKGDFLMSISMISADEGWAVGPDGESTGVILHYQTGSWTIDSYQYFYPLNAIKMVSAQDGWAVGGLIRRAMNGFALHYHDGQWQVQVTNASPFLFGIDALSGDEAWAVGEDDILHYSSGRWQGEEKPAQVGLKGIKMISPDEGWAVGSGIVHYSGGRWSLVASPVGADLWGISMLGANEGWAVGKGGTILHYSSGAWSQYPSPTKRFLYDVNMVSADEGWAVGEAGTILHYQNGTWSIYQ